MYKNTVNLYNKLLAMYFNNYYSITDEENYPSNLFLKGYKYNERHKSDEEKSKSVERNYC